MFHKGITSFLLAVLALGTPAGGFAQAGDQDEPKRVGDPYPLSTCAVSGEELGSMGAPIVRLYDGREMRFCCDGCPAQFEANPAEFTEKVDEAIIKQQEAYYPMETCPVSGQPLGGMGEPFQLVHGNRLVQLCCEGCLEKFEAEPEAYLEKLDAAVIAAQKDDYPLQNCIIAGSPLGGMGEPFEAVYANRLVRFCCEGCVAEFEKNPAAHLAKLVRAGEAEEPAETAAAPETDAHAGHAH